MYVWEALTCSTSSMRLKVTIFLTAVDLCASSPCLSNQNCASIGDIYVCSCLPGYTGDVCQTGTDNFNLQ